MNMKTQACLALNYHKVFQEGDILLLFVIVFSLYRGVISV